MEFGIFGGPKEIESALAKKMTDTLFEIEPTVPRWKELADLHGIDLRKWTGIHLADIHQQTEEAEKWLAEIIWFGELESETAESEREAVIALIHRLQLEGWKTVSL